MGDTASDPVDHHRTTRPHAGESMKDPARMPGLILIAVAIAAVMFGIAGFAAGQVSWGVVAAVVALVAVVCGLVWTVAERRRAHARPQQPPPPAP